MASHCCAPYRGYGIEVHVSPDTTGTLGGKVAGYALRWRVSPPGAPHDEVVSFAEQCVFIAEFDAIAYGEGRAHTFIGQLLALESPKPAAADRQRASEHTFKA